MRMSEICRNNKNNKHNNNSGNPLASRRTDGGKNKFRVLRKTVIGSFYILLTYEGSTRISLASFEGSAKGCFRPRLSCTPSLNSPVANFLSTQSQ